MNLSSLHKEVFENNINGLAIIEISKDKISQNICSRIIEYNKAFQNICIAKSNDLNGSKIEELFENDTALWKSYFNSALNYNKPITFEIYNNSTDRCYEVTLTNIHTNIFSVSFYDCTKRKNIEIAWSKSESNLRAIFNSGEQAFILLDKNYIIQAFNKNAILYSEKIYGQKINVGENLLDFFEAKYKNQFIRLFNNTLAGKSITIDFNFITKHLKDNWYEVRLSAVYSEYGLYMGILIVLNPINERKLNEKKMKKLITALKYANKITAENMKRINALNIELADSEQKFKELNANKDKLFSILAHDLRTPLQGFLSLTDQLLLNFEDLNKEDIIDLASEMNLSAGNIYKLLENLLQWSRIQRNKIEFEPMQLNLQTILKMNTELYKQNIESKALKLVQNISSDLEVFADVNMLNTAIRNLISNAIKYSYQNGTIEINAEILDDYFIKLDISDNGVGMRQEVVDSLFKIDFNVSTPGTNNEVGTGLGLILCKELIEKNNGKIEVSSIEGEGTTFSLTLPRFMDIESRQQSFD